LAVLSSLLSAGQLLAAGGTIQDQAVSLTYPALHWNGLAEADLLGSYPTPATDPIQATGWWYRINGVDTREHPFPRPDREHYDGGRIVLEWDDVDGKGFRATEITTVVDNERPSASLLTELTVENLTAGDVNVIAFHYLDVDLPGNGDDDNVIEAHPVAGSYGRDLVFYSAHGGGSVRYRGDGGLFLTGPSATVLGGLNDDLITNFTNSGAPFGPSNAGAGYMWWLFMHPGQQLHARASASIRPRAPYVKGEWGRSTGHPTLLFRKLAPADPYLEHSSWDMRRTSRLDGDPISLVPHGRVVGADDFNGDFRTDLVQHDAASGQTYVRGIPVTGALPAPLFWRIEATGDFDLDGKPDLVWRSSTSGKLVIWRMDDTAKLGEIVPVPDQAADLNWAVAAALDFNDDGRRDLLWYNATSGKIVIWYMNAAVQRISGAFTTPSSAGNNNWKVVAAGDFGKGPVTSGAPAPVFGAPDIVWRNASSGKLVVWHMDLAGRRTAGVFTSPDAPDDPLGYEVVGPR
jgi:hypothetical protein